MPRRSPSQAQPAGRYRAPALDKGLDILELLSERPDGLTQAEIARSLERSVGEIFRMLNCLVERGYLSILRPGDRYVLTLKLFELSHRHQPLQRLLDEALPSMKQLAARVHQSVHLAVMHEGKAIVVAQVDSPGEIGFAVRVGSIISLITTASGRVLLAFQEHDERERMLAQGKLRLEASEHTKTFSALDKIKKRGYEDMESTRIRGVHDVSYPVVNYRGAAVGAMTIPFIERVDSPSHHTLATTRAALSEAARKLSLTLGAGTFLAREEEGAHAP